MSTQSKTSIDDDGVILENGDLVNKDGKKLYCYYWKPKDGNIKALVHVNHGFAEHMQWYDHLGRLLASRGFLAFGHDHVGHGKSEGDRVFVNSADDYVQDVFQHTEHMKKKYPNLAVHIFGHSMGGMIVLNTVLKHPGVYKTMSLMGPLIALDSTLAPPFVQFLAKMADRFIPQFAVSKLRKELVTRDPDMQQKILDDDLFWKNGVKVHWFVAVAESIQYNLKHLQDVDIPFHVLHGTADKLCDINGSKLLLQSSVSKDKKFKAFPDAGHNLFSEYPDVRKEALHDTVNWIEQRV